MNIEKLKLIEVKFNQIQEQLSHPDVMKDMKKYVQLNKDYSNLEPIVKKSKEYISIYSNIISSKEILNKEKDEEFKELAKEELDNLEAKIIKCEEELKILLIPEDPDDHKNCIIEIRGGTGGDEASIFAGDLFRMYTKYCDSLGWKWEVVDINQGNTGGYKEVIFNVNAKGAYGKLKYEAGVHRVQRVPDTETMGRVHTSAATVVVMPEAEEFDVVLKNEDIRKDTFCSSGPGGQSVNTTYSAIRLTHIPTNTVVSCQDEKSQIKNYEKALKVLRSRIYEIELQKRMEEQSKKRKTMVSSGDRSDKIRTYNYPQSRVTDHRIGLTLYNLPNIINGELDELIEAITVAENTEKLKAGETI